MQGEAKDLHFCSRVVILSEVRQLTDEAKNLHFGPVPNQLQTLRSLPWAATADPSPTERAQGDK